MGPRGADDAMAQLYGSGDHCAGAARGSRRGDLTRHARRGVQTDARDTTRRRRSSSASPTTRVAAECASSSGSCPPVVASAGAKHLENMDYLREGVHLRSMAQKDPLVEYTSEGERMFTDLAARSAARSCCISSTGARAGGRRGARAAAATTAAERRQPPLRARDDRGRQAIAQAGAGEAVAAGSSVGLQTVAASRTRSSAATSRAGAAAARSQEVPRRRSGVRPATTK